MTSMSTDPARTSPDHERVQSIGIAEMAARCGLSPDTLRWYEKEGILPRVARASDGRRTYTPQDQALVSLLTALRATGMTTEQMRTFVRLMAEGAASHGRRVALLQAVRERLESKRREIDAAQRALDAKVEHYTALIAAGRDCDGAPVPNTLRAQQADPTLS